MDSKLDQHIRRCFSKMAGNEHGEKVWKTRQPQIEAPSGVSIENRIVNLKEIGRKICNKTYATSIASFHEKRFTIQSILSMFVRLKEIVLIRYYF